VGLDGERAAARAGSVLGRRHVSEPEDADGVEVLEALLQPRLKEEKYTRGGYGRQIYIYNKSIFLSIYVYTYR